LTVGAVSLQRSPSVKSATTALLVVLSLSVTCCSGEILIEPIYFERDRYDLPLPLIEYDPNFAPSEGETTLTQTIADPAEQQRRIFQALTQVLTPLGVRFEFSIQHLPQAVAFDDRSLQTMFQSPELSRDSLKYRLLVRCHSQKSLECQLLAAPLARRLRAIQLEHFTEAIVQFARTRDRDVAKSAQVADWRLKIDLTPPVIRLIGWARWGDVQAITHLLNDALAPAGVQVSTMLKNLTLQVFCTLKHPEAARFPAKKIVIDTIAPLLISLTPQGLQGATIHGLQSSLDPYHQMEEPPVWIHWLDLPALGDPQFSPTPIALAARGDREALSFILERLLNPDLEQYFELGGINLSLLDRQRSIHVMSEAPNCPIQSQVAMTVVKVIKQLQLPGIRGVRVHGRRAGQAISLWTYGVDFDPPQRLLAPPTIATNPSSTQPSAVKTPRIELDWRSRIGAALVATGMWQPQLNLVNPNQLAYQPRFQWQPSLLLLLVGLGLTIAGDVVIKLALETKQIVPQSIAATTTQLSFNNPLLEQKLAQYQLRCLQHGVPDVLIVGSSRALRGVDPEVLRRGAIERGYRNPKLYNFGINGATAQVVDLILRQLLTSQQLPKLVIWADGARAFNSGRSDRTYEAIALSDRYRQLALISGLNNHNSPLFQAQSSVRDLNRAIDTTIDVQLAKVSPAYHHRDRLKTWLQSKVPLGIPRADRVNANQLEPSSHNDMPVSTHQDIDFDGFLPLAVQFDPQTYYQQHAKVTGDSDGDYANFQLLGSQDRALHQTIDLLASHQIQLVFVNMPLTDIYLDKFRLKYEASFKQYMQKMMDSHQLTFVDLDGVLNTRHELFSDPSHLNQFGALEVSKYLARIPKIRW
jgi:hypothetical protein